jgi:hypothetical protein
MARAMKPILRSTFRPLLLITLGAAALPDATAQVVDDLRVRQLENEVLRLQRQLDAQSRRIEALERGQRETTTARSPTALPSVPRPQDDSPAWLISTNWDKVRPGMKELDVIALLGRPTTVRLDPDGKSRAFMYALELGPNAILAGNVRLTDDGVAEVNKPTLR